MASNSKKRRRVLGASCILAALIIASSSFAWFTSKDEVTNRLSATADYDVAIAEDFTPPEKWVPGQQINKDVAATNTGNIDAFARMRLSGEMRILQTTASADFDGDNATTAGAFTDAAALFNTTATTNDVEDSDLVKMGLTKFATDGTNAEPRYYFKSLSTTSTKNPKDNQQTNNQDDYNAENNTDYYSEVQAMQAGGVLAYAPTGAEYTYVLNQEAELPIYSTGNEVITRKVPAGTRVYVTNETPASTWLVDKTAPVTATTVWVPAQTFAAGSEGPTDHFNPVNVDADSFQPLTPGLYLFNRNVDLNALAATNPNDYEFSGYYYSDYDTVITDNNGTTSMSHTLRNTKVATTEATNHAAWVDNDGKITAANGDYGKGTYYALKAENDLKSGDNRSDYTVPNGKTGNATATDPVKAVTVTELDNDLYYVAPTADLELYTAAYNKIDASTLKFRTAGDTKTTIANNTIYAIYDKTPATLDQLFDAADDIVVEIGLANVGTDASNKWTPINKVTAASAGYTIPYSSGDVNAKWDAKDLTFYYNDDIESGDTSEKLIDYVKLSDVVTNKAYLAFDFDLNVFMDSIQVTYDEDGKENDTPVSAATGWATTTDGSTAKGAKTLDGNEISKEAWTEVTTP